MYASGIGHGIYIQCCTSISCQTYKVNTIAPFYRGGIRLRKEKYLSQSRSLSSTAQCYLLFKVPQRGFELNRILSRKTL